MNKSSNKQSNANRKSKAKSATPAADENPALYGACTMTPEQEAAHARFKAEQEAMRRAHCTQLSFWLVCDEKRCRRVKSCSGDPHACFARWWPVVPEEFKHWYRGALAALSAGKTQAETVQAGNAEVARCREIEARCDRLFAENESMGAENAAPDATAASTTAPSGIKADAAGERPVARIRRI